MPDEAALQGLEPSGMLLGDLSSGRIPPIRFGDVLAEGATAASQGFLAVREKSRFMAAKRDALEHFFVHYPSLRKKSSGR
jgi:hypothetical protein